MATNYRNTTITYVQVEDVTVDNYEKKMYKNKRKVY